MVILSINRSKVRKVVLAGDPGVGKTSIRHNYMGKNFQSSYMATIGADFAIKRIGDAALQIWDLAGQPMYKSVREGYYRGAQGIILIYDITRPQSFVNVSKWINEITERIKSTLPMVLVANKADLREDTKDHVKEQEGKDYARVLTDWSGMEVQYLETSAKTGLNIEDVFTKLLSEIDIFIQSQVD